MALSLTQPQKNIFTKSPFKSPFRESNQFFEKFNIKCLMNEKNLLTPNKPNLPSFKGSSTKKRELTPISFMAINHLFNSPESKLYLQSLEKRKGVAMAIGSNNKITKNTSNFETAKNDEFSLKLLKEDCNDQILLNQPFSQIKLIRTYSDPTDAKLKKIENLGGKFKIDLYEILKHDLMMLENTTEGSGGDKDWNTWSSYESFRNEWGVRKSSSDEKDEEELEILGREQGISLLNYVDFDEIEENLGKLLKDISVKLENSDFNGEVKEEEKIG